MIIDNLENITKYTSLLPGLAKVPVIIEKIDLNSTERVEFEGGFYFVQKGVTRPVEETIFETHENYIDVQILLEGKEMMGWNTIPNLKVKESYDSENDITIYFGEDSPYNMNIPERTFYVFYPWDAHRAAFHQEEANEYIKLIVKLKVIE